MDRYCTSASARQAPELRSAVGGPSLWYGACAYSANTLGKELRAVAPVKKELKDTWAAAADYDLRVARMTEWPKIEPRIRERAA